MGAQRLQTLAPEPGDALKETHYVKDLQESRKIFVGIYHANWAKLAKRTTSTGLSVLSPVIKSFLVGSGLFSISVQEDYSSPGVGASGERDITWCCLTNQNESWDNVRDHFRWIILLLFFKCFHYTTERVNISRIKSSA